MSIRTVGIVGYGHFGKFIHELCKRLAPDLTVKIYSRRGVVGEESFRSLAEVAACDVVMLCGAINEYEAQLLSVIDLAPQTTILVDVATVKSHTSQLLQRYASDRLYLSTHPMFGPESYRKCNESVEGFRVVLCDHTLPEEQYHSVREHLTSLGFRVLEMTPDEHDQRLAETLFLTHYVSQSIVAGGFARTDIDTASFGFLMDAVESVKHDTALFHDVYRFNPYCAVAVKRLHKAQEHVCSQLPDDVTKIYE